MRADESVLKLNEQLKMSMNIHLNSEINCKLIMPMTMNLLSMSIHALEINFHEYLQKQIFN